MFNHLSLKYLGWQTFFEQQLTDCEPQDATPARIIEQYKSEITVATSDGAFNISLLHGMPEFVVGDWLLLDADQNFIRLLNRKTLFSRKAAGLRDRTQLIASNVDTAFIVCSMNDDFNLNRIERYLAIVHEAEATPVIVLSKADQCDEPQAFIDQAKSLGSDLQVVSLNCLDAASIQSLKAFLQVGHTMAVLGSSGVGKSTLVNTLLGEQVQSTADIREDDSRGRHTTTKRSLISLGERGLILDTPGMREIQLEGCAHGIAVTFAEISELVNQCKFRDCKHESEPGCVIKSALENGDIVERRLNNYLKLLEEDARHSEAILNKPGYKKS